MSLKVSDSLKNRTFATKYVLMRNLFSLLVITCSILLLQACHGPGDLPAADAVNQDKVSCSVDGRTHYALVDCEVRGNYSFDRYEFVYAKDSLFLDAHSVDLQYISSNLHRDTVSDLDADCAYFYYIEISDLIGSARTKVDTFHTAARSLPVVMTDSLYLLRAQLHCLGSYLPDEESPITGFGFVWSLDSTNLETNGTLLNATSVPMDDMVRFVATIDSLETTTYYLKAYATNAAGTAYGRMLSCSYTRLQVSTDSIKDVKPTTCTLYGTVVEKGSEECQMVRTGFCISEHELPTTDDVTFETDRPIQQGPYVCQISGLNPGRFYHVRAFAQTRSLTGVETTAYGEDMELLTMETMTVVLDPIEESNVTSQYVILEGEVTNNGGATIKERGFLWIRLSSGQSPNIFNCDGKQTCDLGSNNGLGAFSAMVMVNPETGLSTNEKYVVVAYVMANDDSVVYSESQIFTIPDRK